MVHETAKFTLGEEAMESLDITKGLQLVSFNCKYHILYIILYNKICHDYYEYF